jgi:hypothetical protein
MHEQIAERFFCEDAATILVGLSARPVDPVGKLYNAHGRDRNVDLTIDLPSMVKNIFDCFSATLACNQDAGV